MKSSAKTYLNLLKGVLFCALLSGCNYSCDNKSAAGPQSPQKYNVRVRLYKRIEDCRVSIPQSFEIIDIAEDKSGNIHQGSKSFEVSIRNGCFQLGSLQFNTTALTIVPKTNSYFSINNRRYRGRLKLVLNPDGKSFMAINSLPMEAYLYGVIAAEMPNYWEKDALKAQAVAARTYCYYIRHKFGTNRLWDVKTTQANQVYKGIAVETSRTKQAVESTSGMVLTAADGDGPDKTFPAYYNAICGGHTENSKNVFGDSFKSLAGVECPYCIQIARPGVFFWPTVDFDKEFVNARLFKRYPLLKKLEGIKDITVKKEKDYGDFKRLITVKITGINGKTSFLRAEDFRLAIDPTGYKIRSTIFILISFDDKYFFTAGRGFGHGVGLCQYGARQMARDGMDYQRILKFYYPGSKIKKLY